MKVVNYGSLNLDYTFSVEKIVQAGQTIAAHKQERYLGGKGFNQSIAIARAGGSVFHAGNIGEDGMELKSYMEQEGVDCSYLNMQKIGTGTAFIQVEESGQNSIVICGGANCANTTEHCDKVLRSMGEGDVILLQNEINCLSYLIDQAYERGIKVYFNPSPITEEIQECHLDKVSFFIMNEDEGKQITGKKETEEILKEMEDKYQNAEVVLTLGSKGSVYAYRGQRIYQNIIQADAIDTTGAGDTYTGYLLAHLVHGDGVKKSMEYAAIASAIAVTRSGAASSIPRFSEVEAIRLKSDKNTM